MKPQSGSMSLLPKSLAKLLDEMIHSNGPWSVRLGVAGFNPDQAAGLVVGGSVVHKQDGKLPAGRAVVDSTRQGAK